jgi:hypothetical protein
VHTLAVLLKVHKKKNAACTALGISATGKYGTEVTKKRITT